MAFDMERTAEELKGDLVVEELSQGCKTCGELEKRVVELEPEIKNARIENKALVVKLEELNASRKRNGEVMVYGGNDVKGVDGAVDLTGEEEGRAFELMVENQVLECEKKKAEIEVEVWKPKYKKLEMCVLRGGDGRSMRCQDGELVDQEIKTEIFDVEATCNSAGTPFTQFASKDTPLGRKKCYGSVRKRLSFEEGEGIPNKEMRPSTPGSAKPACLSIINVLDSEEESEACGVKSTRKVCVSKDDAAVGALDSVVGKSSENSLGKGAYDKRCEAVMDPCKDNVPCIPTPKRKRAANIVRSDSESDDDDNIPICKLKRFCLQEPVADTAAAIVDDVRSTLAPPRRRLMSLRECEDKFKTEKSSSIKNGNARYERGTHTTDDLQDEGSEEEVSDSEGDSMDEFIVEESDISDSNDAYCHLEDESEGNSNRSEDESEDNDRQPRGKLDENDSQSDGNVDFNGILSMIQRSKDHKFKWKFEAEMLADFGKHPELCMKAVCALYRQQTSDEQACRATLNKNTRGFSQSDALRGSNLAMFLTHGDPWSAPKKSIKELHEYDPKAVEMCRTLATHYSRQLFEIYKNKEDPLFQ